MYPFGTRVMEVYCWELRSQYMKQDIHVNELTLYYGILCYVMHLVILYFLL